MAELAVMPTQSISTENVGDDDMTLLGHISKSINVGAEGEGSPQGSTQRADSVEKTTKDVMVKHPVSFSPCKKYTDDANAKLMEATGGFSTQLKEGEGGMGDFSSNMDLNVEDLKDNIKGDKKNQAMEAKLDKRPKLEEHERKILQDEFTSM